MTNDIGNIKGRLLVFGGSYSNYQALQRLKEIAEDEGIPISNIICTGDIIGYCAQPEECVNLIREWGIHTIAGNVEIQIREALDDCGCNFEKGSRCDLFSRTWYPYAVKNTSQESKDWLHTIPDFIEFQFAGMNGLVLHGGISNPSEFIFKSSPWRTKKVVLDSTYSDFILAGHCGLPFNNVSDGKYWLNAGVIGMPANDATHRVWYMILDDSNGFTFEHRSFEFDYQTTADLMSENALPESYIKTLSTGLWDNNDILPEEETILQGKKIVF